MRPKRVETLCIVRSTLPWILTFLPARIIPVTGLQIHSRAVIMCSVMPVPCMRNFTKIIYNVAAALHIYAAAHFAAGADFAHPICTTSISISVELICLALRLFPAYRMCISGWNDRTSR